MHVIRRWMFIAAFAAAAQLFAQTGTGSGSAAAPCKCASRPPAPYSATFKITSVRTLADGTTISQTGTSTNARDSAGRWMTSTTSHHFGNSGTTVIFGNANDPVAGIQTSWNSQSRQASVLQLPPADERHGCWADESGTIRTSYEGSLRPRVAPLPQTVAKSGAPPTAPRTGVGSSPSGSSPNPSVKREDLGTSTMVGVQVHGQRITTTTPAGQIGNDRPIVSTWETWIATNLGITLRSIRDDPETGKTTQEVQSLDLGEPPISMFQPPEGYRVVIQQLHKVDCPNHP